ncbi:hypothetical protein LOTGIDRAFT_163832 [Lottia gigantea]|uniref:Uncharacterized protein n=1 Tax=Lottia gigantea TaxID=225164 RepID=V4A1S7_LOTGI|nr:hypothetical protein LOTGIDRAFT_163832 [Lottia gigantea]ESO90632.1 hypothetical protein LOTGIDRAFT_163832 [Lottia gigantea]
MLLALLLFFHRMWLGGTDLIIYPVSPGVVSSDKFSVEVKQGSSAFQGSFVYISHSNNRVGQSPSVKPNRTVSWTSFGFTGDSVNVNVITVKDFKECTVRPESYGIPCTRLREKTASFEMTSNTQKISVEFDYDYGSLKSDIVDKLLIFANPPETYVPEPSNPSVLYYGCDVYDLGGQLQLSSNIRHVYLAPGAFVNGGFRTTSRHPVTISGRGILSGAKYRFHDPRFLWGLINVDIGVNQTVEGITMVDSPQFFYRGLSSYNVVRNIKTVAPWTYNSDGIGIGAYGLVEDSFFQTNDDTFKVYNDGLTVRRCVVWQAQNGAVFQFGWWKQRKAKNIFIGEIDVIHTDWCTFKKQPCSLSQNDAVLDLGGRTTAFNTTNVTISDIRVEGQCPRIFYFVMDPMAKGTVTNFYLNNWSIQSQAESTKLYNELRGAYLGGRIKSWFFNRLYISGKCIVDPGSANIRVDLNTTFNINFSCA